MPSTHAASLLLLRGGARLFSSAPPTRASSKIDYQSFLSRSSLRRKPSPIRALQPLLRIPGIISLGGGMPNPSTFPLQALSFSIKGIGHLALSPAALEGALQYSPTTGLPELVDWLGALQTAQHGVMDNVQVCVTNGSQEGVSRAFEMLLNEGDPIIIESPTYSGSLACLQSLGVKYVCAPTDHDGLIPEKLAAILDSWQPSQGPKPRVLYTIPTGGNPTGASMTLARKKQLYALAQKHNLILLEDDPYYYLQFSASRVPSLLSLDTDGRVLRFDSFSKILSSGIRVGFVTGPEPLVDRIQLHGQATSLHPSGISQAVCLRVLEMWGIEGFEKHVRSVCAFYSQQRDLFLKAAEKHLTGLAEWNPNIGAGMFGWLRLTAVEDSFVLISRRAVEQKVLLVPGNAFYPEGAPPSSHVRASFSTATELEMNEALQRLAKLLRAPSPTKAA